MIVDKTLSFCPHCSNIVKKAKVISCLITRAFISRDPEVLLKAFLVYVRPILEYASVVWNPYLIKDISAIESVQRRFTKKILANKTLTYAQRLKHFSVESLEKRRLVYDLSLMYSIVKCNILPFHDFFTGNENPTRNNHPWKMQIQKYHCNIRKNDFSNRVTNIWNSLPRRIVESHTLKLFLTRLNEFDLMKISLGPL